MTDQEFQYHRKGSKCWVYFGGSWKKGRIICAYPLLVKVGWAAAVVVERRVEDVVPR